MTDIDKDVLKIYRDYNYERASIFYKREELGCSKPWTHDPILLNNKFTNVNRRLDKESRWLISNIIENDNISLENKILNIFLFRTVNSGDAMSGIYNDYVNFDYDNFEQLVSKEINMDYKGNVQSGAYFLSHIKKYANTLSEEYKYTLASLPFMVFHHKHKILSSVLLRDDSYNHGILYPKECIAILQTIPSIGNFLSYQIWVDYSYLSEYTHNTTNIGDSKRISIWTDNDYVVSGPGCDLGVDWIIWGDKLINKETNYPDYGKSKVDYNKFLYWFRDNINNLMKENSLQWSPKEFLHFLPDRLQHWGLMEIENSFCELNKLMKIRNEISMRSRKYNGAS